MRSAARDQPISAPISSRSACDLAEQPVDAAGVDDPGAEVLRGLGAAGDPEAQALDRILARVAGRDVAGQERVSRPDDRARLLLLDPDPMQRRRAVLEDLRIAAVGHGHDRLARAQPGHLDDRLRAVVGVVELVADELLGLELVRRDQVGLGPHRQSQRLAVGVDHRRHAEPAHLADQRRVDVLLDPAREAAGEHADARALGQVEQLLAEQLELLRRDGRTTLVDLGVQPGGRVEHDRVGPRLVVDADEVVEDRLVAERLDDPRAGGAAGKPGGDHRLPELLDRAGDVDALAARHRGLIDGAVAAARA